MSLLFPGTSHSSLAESIAKRYKFTLGKCEIKKFSCGETYVKILEHVRGTECFIVQTITKSANDDLMETYLLADALRRHDAERITAIIPHFGYARQDRRASLGEPISAQLVAKLLVASGVTNIITFDLHSDQIEGFFTTPVDNLHCYQLFADYFQKKQLPDPVIVVPDTGAAKLADRLTRVFASPMAILHKTRPAHHKVSHTHLVGDVKNKTVILFDDMIDTGGSICSAKNEGIALGARKDGYVAATHAVFSGQAYGRLESADFAEIVVTDTIPLAEKLPNITVLSVVELLYKIL
ncbi:MAG: hypothetical protein A2249_04015 [Candidatus Jacksonbacteria bacterium RIFOXYA2_FULL_44_7]|nr:MAG: hypothetical protein A2249_04015 [Candidatus Jacksonbacteria bacterium RIFOXYA2_FULL_44_7]